jgi:thermitase
VVVVGDGHIVPGRLFDPIFYATGLPITDAYWAEVKVGGQVKDVLIQAFERRILTYTPSNPRAYRLEMGNVGQHYYRWRYGQ